MSKKLILSIAIIVIILNALLPQYIYATDTIKMDSLEGQNARNEIEKETQQDVESTEVPIVTDIMGGITQVGSVILGEAGNLAGVIVRIIVKILCLIPYSIQMLMTFVTTGDSEEIYTGSTFGDYFDASKVNWFTIEKAVFGQVPLFNVDFFDVTTDDSSVNSTLKQSVASWYYVSLRAAQILSIVTLIYIGIRMAMASNPEDKVNYKKMFKYWIIGFAMLFLLHYGIVIILKTTNFFISLIPESMLDNNFETEIIGKTINVFDTDESIWSILLYFITYVIIVGYEVYFFYKYFKRLLTMGFLVIIAPLITVTYPIDKADDGEAKAYTTWMKLFLSNAFMQAVHALMYTIFVFSASEIALKAPMIAIVFFIGIIKAEDVFNKLFGLSTK